MVFDDDLNACAAIVEKGDPWRFRTVMAAPVAARAKLFPLYAFNVEVSRAPWVTAEPMIAEMRLQWWRDALEEIGAGGVVRRHEVVTPLSTLLSAEMVQALDELVAARRWECYKDPFEDHATLETYLRATSANLMVTASNLLGATEGAADIGFAYGVSAWLRAIPELESQKRIPLVDGTPDGVRRFANSGLEALQNAPKRFAKLVLPAIWPAYGAKRVLQIAKSDPNRVAQGTLPEPSRTGFALKALLGRW